MRGDFFAFGDNFVGRFHNGRTTHCQRARTVGAHAKRHAPGVTVDDVDILDRNAEFAGDHLCKRRFMSLAMAMRTGEDGDFAGRVYAHFARFKQSRART